jgi:AraC-like DNA-binding protein
MWMGVTSNHLRNETRAWLDLEARTAKRIIDERLALEARRMIANSDETIDAIAFALRFQVASNLTQYFRRVTGLTPSEFRRIRRGT